MENKFKKGLILGGLLAVGAAVGFAFTKPGQELLENVQDDAKMLAKKIKKALHKMEDVTKETYDNLVETVVEEYATKKELAIDVKNALVDTLRREWHAMEEQYQDLKADEEIE